MRRFLFFCRDRGKPEYPFPRPHIAKRRAGVERGRGFFPIPFHLGRGPSTVPPYLGSDPGGQSESLWGGGRWRLHVAAGGKQPGGAEGEVGG